MPVTFTFGSLQQEEIVIESSEKSPGLVQTKIDRFGKIVAPKRHEIEMASIVKTLNKSKRCVVVTGAGISVSGGIPDFRSSDGLYNLVKQKYPHAVVKGKDLFDANLFRDPTSTKVFYTFISELKQTIQKASTTSTHEFVRDLDSRGKLLRCYTQNIDGLEARLGMCTDLNNLEREVAPPFRKPKSRKEKDSDSPVDECSSGSTDATLTNPVKQTKVVQLHGDLDTVVCASCKATFPFDECHVQDFGSGTPPACPACEERCNERVRSGKRALKIGCLRPNIVLYNEPHPRGETIGGVMEKDLKKKPDCMVVMGTSLKVVGIKKLVRDMAQTIKQAGGHCILINRTPVGQEWNDVFDYHVVANTDEATSHIMKELSKLEATDDAKRRIRDDRKAIKEEHDRRQEVSIAASVQLMQHHLTPKPHYTLPTISSAAKVKTPTPPRKEKRQMTPSPQSSDSGVRSNTKNLPNKKPLLKLIVNDFVNDIVEDSEDESPVLESPEIVPSCDQARCDSGFSEPVEPEIIETVKPEPFQVTPKVIKGTKPLITSHFSIGKKPILKSTNMFSVRSSRT